MVVQMLSINRFIYLIIFFFSFSCSSSYIQHNSNSRILKNVPFYPQQEYQCGPSSLAGVMNYHGLNITPEKIADDIFSKSAKGTLGLDMVIYAKNKGVRAMQYAGSLDDLKANINSGYPLIVLVDYGFLFYQHNHFMVIIGYNDYGILVNSGSADKQFIDTESFVKTWEKTNYWTLLIKKRD